LAPLAVLGKECAISRRFGTEFEKVPDSGRCGYFRAGPMKRDFFLLHSQTRTSQSLMTNFARF
jgi:hypothetical protein